MGRNPSDIKGDLTYKIDTTTLTGESYEMAQAVNEMGDGLQGSGRGNH